MLVLKVVVGDKVKREEKDPLSPSSYYNSYNRISLPPLVVLSSGEIISPIRSYRVMDGSEEGALGGLEGREARETERALEAIEPALL